VETKKAAVSEAKTEEPKMLPFEGEVGKSLDAVYMEKDGEWVINTGEFSLADPDNGKVYSAGIPTKVKITGWAKRQPVMRLLPGFEKTLK
jgi:hypothetical protein